MVTSLLHSKFSAAQHHLGKIEVASGYYIILISIDIDSLKVNWFQNRLSSTSYLLYLGHVTVTLKYVQSLTLTLTLRRWDVVLFLVLASSVLFSQLVMRLADGGQ